MTSNIQASAPGKLVIAGEYAVLDGALAISASVNKRAVVTAEPAASGELLIVNSGSRYAFRIQSDGQPDWLNDPGDSGALLTAALSVMARQRRLPTPLQAWKLSICSREFYASLPDGSTCKLGTGSSAAVAVALAAALQGSVGKKPDLALCLDVHREFQQGGSGIDIATSWYGGVVLMQPHAQEAPVIQRLNWPEGLHMRPVWTGVAASTPAMLRRLDTYKTEAAKDYANLLQQFTSALNEISRSWYGNSAGSLVEGLGHYGELLAALDSAAGIGIWSDRHRRLQSIANSMGIGYKPSGAGGGDFGLVFALDADAINAFLHQVHVTLVPQTHGVDWATDGLLINGRTVPTKTDQ